MPFNRVISLLMLLMMTACQPAKETKQQSLLQIASGKAVERDVQLKFPADHGIHPEQGIEWWYITAVLKSESGESFGVQWTLFRTLMPSNIKSVWWDNNLYFAHFAIQHRQQHVAFERFSRAKQAIVTTAPFRATLDDWLLASQGENFFPLMLQAQQDSYQINLQLDESPMALHGEQGYSQKTPSGHASYYYSYPFLPVSGELTFAGQQYKVQGNAWYDREWSASLLDKNQLGWDWFSLVDEHNQQGLMLFCIRGDKQSYDYCSGSQIHADGATVSIPTQDISLVVLDTVSLDNSIYPSKWQINLPNRSPIIIDTVTKDARNKLTIPYWEGRVKASGSFNGEGYAELTGY